MVMLPEMRCKSCLGGFRKGRPVDLDGVRWLRVSSPRPTKCFCRGHRGNRVGQPVSLLCGIRQWPAFLVGPEWLDRVAGEDAELSCRVLPEPDWWALKVARPAPPAVAAERAQAASLTEQLSLIGVAPAKASPVPTAVSAEPVVVVRLRQSKVFAQQTAGVPKPEVERVLTWLGVLLEAGAAMTAADFAHSCGVRPHQVGGVVARMGILNADGFAIVEHDVAGRRVVLQKTRLLSQFGVGE